MGNDIQGCIGGAGIDYNQFKLGYNPGKTTPLVPGR